MTNASLGMQRALEALSHHPLIGIAALLAAFSLAVLSEVIARRTEHRSSRRS